MSSSVLSASASAPLSSSFPVSAFEMEEAMARLEILLAPQGPSLGADQEAALLAECESLASDFAWLPEETMARYLANNPNENRWQAITAYVNHITLDWVERQAAELYPIPVEEFDRLLKPKNSIGYWPATYQRYKVHSTAKKVLDRLLNSPTDDKEYFELYACDVLWDIGLVEFLWEKGQALIQAGIPEDGSPEYIRILTPDTEEEFEVKEEARRIAVEEEMAVAVDQCRKLAPQFDRLRVDEMAKYLQKNPAVDRWTAITSCLSPAMLAQVQKTFQKKEKEERSHELWRLMYDKY